MKAIRTFIFAIFVTIILLCSICGHAAAKIIKPPKTFKFKGTTVSGNNKGTSGGDLTTFWGIFKQRPSGGADSVPPKLADDANPTRHHVTGSNKQLTGHLFHHRPSSATFTQILNHQQPSFLPEAVKHGVPARAAARASESANAKITVSPHSKYGPETFDVEVLKLYNLVNQPEGHQVGGQKNRKKKNKKGSGNSGAGKNTENNSAGEGGDKGNNGGGQQGSSQSGGSGASGSGSGGGDKKGNNGGGKKPNNDNNKKKTDPDDDSGDGKQPEKNAEAAESEINNTPIKEGAAAGVSGNKDGGSPPKRPAPGVATASGNNDGGSPPKLFKATRSSSSGAQLDLDRSGIRHIPLDINVLDKSDTDVAFIKNYIARMAMSKSNKNFPLTKADVKDFLQPRFKSEKVTLIRTRRSDFLNNMVLPEYSRVLTLPPQQQKITGGIATLTIKHSELRIADVYLTSPQVSDVVEINVKFYKNAKITIEYNLQKKSITHLSDVYVEGKDCETTWDRQMVFSKGDMEAFATDVQKLTVKLQDIATKGTTDRAFSQYDNSLELDAVLGEFSRSVDKTIAGLSEPDTFHSNIILP